MRRLLKFLHTLAGAVLMGGAAALVVALLYAPTSSAEGQVAVFAAMANIATWIIGPSMVLTVITGLLAMLMTPAFRDAGWVWAKAASGILILQAGLHVMGPIQEAARRNASTSSDGADTTIAAGLFEAEVNTLWVLLAVSVANVALGVWRPRFPQYAVK